MISDTLLKRAAALALCAAVTACGQSSTAAAGAGALPNARAVPQAVQAARTSYAIPLSLQQRYAQEAALRQLDPLAASLKPNQTVGYGAGKLLVFTYLQQFDCVVQPFDDRNYSGVIAALDPQQFAMPECQVGAPSTIDPTGGPVTKTDPLYVLVPFFETNKKTPAFTPALGKALKKLFGFVPDAFKPDPGVYVQCPAPKDMPGTCTMHPLQTDLGPVLTALKLLPPKTTLYVPLVDHSHLLGNNTINQSPEWWQVIVVLVENPKAWPNEAGTMGITSVAKLRAAQKAGEASSDVPTNFFLYFSSKVMRKSMQMAGGSM
jgi:hypothetical protein